MKNCLLVVMILLSVSCSYSGEIEERGDQPTNVQKSPIPSQKLLDTLTPKQNPTSKPSITFTPSMQERKDLLIGLIKDNGGCLLPCLWGITPGITHENKAQDVLSPLVNLSQWAILEEGSGSVSPEYVIGEKSIFSDFTYLSDKTNQLVKMISFKLESHQILADGGYVTINNLDQFGELVEKYNLSTVLTEFGMPDSILIGTLANDFSRGGSWGFHILLIYSQKGFLIDYTTEAKYINKSIVGCPNNSQISIEAFASGDDKAFFNNLQSTEWSQNISSNYKTINEVTGYSIERFFKTFKQKTEECIQTPLILWPKAD